MGDRWQVAFGVGVGCAVVSGALLYSIAALANAGARGRGETPRASGRREGAETQSLIPGRLQAVAATNGLVHSAAVAGVGGIFGPFVLHTLDLSLLHGSILLLPAIGTGAASMWLAGRRSRPGRRLRELALCYAVGAVTLAGLIFVESSAAFAIVAVGLGVAIGGATPLMGATILDVSHRGEARASILGWLFFAQGIGSVAGPVAVGVVISLLGVREAVAFLGAFDAVVVALLLGSSRVEAL
jgi:MFS family permease